MRNGNYDERTVLQTHNPGAGARFVPVVVLEGVSLPFDSPMHLTIDGARWYSATPRAVVIDTQARTVTTTITVIKDE
jgi:hypothetical protein